jgi:hypothetical protein
MLVVMMVFIMVMTAAFQHGNSTGSIQNGPVCQQVSHKILKTCAGQNDQFSGFCSLNLTDAEGIIVEAGNIFTYQLGNGKICTAAQLGGEFIYRQGGGGDLGRRLLRCAACQQEK